MSRKAMTKVVAWIVPAIIDGSGGHRTIFQHINFMSDAGYQCDVYVQNQGLQLKELTARIAQYFGPCKARIILGWEVEGEYSIGFATAWFTADIVRDYPLFHHRLYFVQDLEAWFNPVGDTYLLAENTYRYRLDTITIGRWLAAKLRRENEAKTAYFDFCADLEIYKSLETTREDAVCFVYQPEKPRRCAELGLRTLAIVKSIRPSTKIYLFGSKCLQYNVNFEFDNLGLISVEQCNKLYNACSVGLCISASNPSRIPFEMMSAGLPVVDVYRENNLYDLPDSAVCLAPPDPVSLSMAIVEILEKKDRRQKMSISGKRFMKDRSLYVAKKQFIDAVIGLTDSQKNEQSNEQSIEALYKVSVPETILDLTLQEFSKNAIDYDQSEWLTKRKCTLLIFHCKEVAKLVLPVALYLKIRSLFR